MTIVAKPPRGYKVEVFFKPRGIAVIGASRDPEKPGHVILYNLRNSFNGPVYPVNPRADVILGMKAYPSILEVPDPVDLAVIAVPAPIVPRVVEEAGKRGVDGVIVISGGFREVGPEGAALEKKVLEIIRKYGMRMIGPNCIGVYSPPAGINATFFDPQRQGLPGSGPIAFLSQSGALGAAMLDWAEMRGIGVSRFVSLGNKADVDESDLLTYLKKDDATQSIALYIEGVEDGKRFREALEDTTPHKPIVALKAGRSEAGARAAASHTGSLAGSYRVYEAVFRQTGVILANTPAEMFDLAMALALQPPMQGNRVGIVTVGGGSGVMATDAAEVLGLKVPEFSSTTQSKLRRILLPIASPRNPVDVTGSAVDEHLLESLRVVAESGEVDGILLIPYFNVRGISEQFPEKLAKVITEIRRKHTIPVVVSATGGRRTWGLSRLIETMAGVPVYTSEAAAVKALWALYHYGKWLKRVGTLEDHIKKHQVRLIEIRH